MKYKIEIDCGNDAFSDSAAQEVARILGALSKSLQGHDSLPYLVNLYDYNGNHVGTAKRSGKDA